MFKRPEVRYGATPELDTPYRRARQAWDDREGRIAINGRRVWRLALVEAGVIAVLATGLVWQGARGQITPWIVEVDRRGEARAVARADADFKPSDFMIAARLERFIQEVRSVSADPIVVRQNWLSAYGVTSAKGARALSAYAQADDPFLRVGKEQVSVEIANTLKVSPTSFRVEWVERRYQDGKLSATERWAATLTVIHRPARNAEHLKKNPLGVYVDAIDWSKEMA